MRRLFFGLLLLSFLLEVAALFVGENQDFGTDEKAVLGGILALLVAMIILVRRFSKGKFELRPNEREQNHDRRQT